MRPPSARQRRTSRTGAHPRPLRYLKLSRHATSRRHALNCARSARPPSRPRFRPAPSSFHRTTAARCALPAPTHLRELTISLPITERTALTPRPSLLLQRPPPPGPRFPLPPILARHPSTIAGSVLLLYYDRALDEHRPARPLGVVPPRPVPAARADRPGADRRVARLCPVRRQPRRVRRVPRVGILARAVAREGRRRVVPGEVRPFLSLDRLFSLERARSS